MSERITISPEQESSLELVEARHEQQERLDEQRNEKAEAAPEKSAEAARHELEKINAETEKKDKEQLEAAPAEKSKKRLPRKVEEKLNFDKKMSEARSSMSPSSKAFSKLIHTQPVEKASEAIGSTVARPNAILAGSLAALILTAAIYFWARYANYPLSGFETIGAFIIGWLVGIIFDFARVMFTGRS